MKFLTLIGYCLFIGVYWFSVALIFLLFFLGIIAAMVLVGTPA